MPTKNITPFIIKIRQEHLILIFNSQIPFSQIYYLMIYNSETEAHKIPANSHYIHNLTYIPANSYISPPPHLCTFCGYLHTLNLNCNFLNYSNRIIHIQKLPSVSKKVITVRGSNLKRNKITIARSTSPYTKKITIRYQSPKKIFYNQLQNQKLFLTKQSVNCSQKEILIQQEEIIKRPKILDRKKKVQSKPKNNFKITFKSVKSAQTNLFIETPQKDQDKNEKRLRQGNTDQTKSAKSLSRISIDERVFQE